MTKVTDESIGQEVRQTIKIEGGVVRGHLDEIVRSTVEETLNRMLEAEANSFANEAS
jgi:putative transposase